MITSDASGKIYWGAGGGGSVGTLADVMNNGNIASKNLNMDNYTIENANLGQLSINIDPSTIPVIESTGTVIPIVLNGTTYYIQIFTVPP